MIEGKYLNKERFNDTIQSLFQTLKLPIVWHSYLSEKIYEIMDEVNIIL